MGTAPIRYAASMAGRVRLIVASPLTRGASWPALPVLDERLDAGAQEEPVEIVGARENGEHDCHPEHPGRNQVKRKELSRSALVEDQDRDGDVLGHRLRLPEIGCWNHGSHGERHASETGHRELPPD